MFLKLSIPFDLRTCPTPADLIDALTPLVPAPLPDDLNVTIVGVNAIVLSYTATFPTPLEAAQWLYTLNNERLPAWYANLYSQPSPPSP